MSKDDIIRMTRKAGLYTHEDVQPEILAFANLVAEAEREAEREACAKLCEAQGEYGWQQYADAIRARSQA